MVSIVYIFAKRQVADDYPPYDLTGKSLVAFFTSLKEGRILPFVLNHHKTVVYIAHQRANPCFLFCAVLPKRTGNKGAEAG